MLLKHYFGTTSAHSTVQVEEKKVKQKPLEIERLMPVRDSPPAQSLLHTLLVQPMETGNRPDITENLVDVDIKLQKTNEKKLRKICC